MRLLLDTHIWLWSLRGSSKLSRRVLRALEDRNNELWLSPISIWELLVLCEKGRVTLDESPQAWVARSMRRAPLKEAPVTHEVALATRAVELTHGDPGDRFLVATAKVFGLTLVTADRRLIAVKDISVLAGR